MGHYSYGPRYLWATTKLCPLQPWSSTHMGRILNELRVDIVVVIGFKVGLGLGVRIGLELGIGLGVGIGFRVRD